MELQIAKPFENWHSTLMILQTLRLYCFSVLPTETTIFKFSSWNIFSFISSSSHYTGKNLNYEISQELFSSLFCISTRHQLLWLQLSLVSELCSVAAPSFTTSSYGRGWGENQNIARIANADPVTINEGRMTLSKRMLEKFQTAIDPFPSFSENHIVIVFF